MAPRKRQRKSASSATLPADLLLEIAARSDATTLIRCAAACRLLRRRIFTDTFIQQQAACVIPPCVLARLRTRRYRPHKPLISLVHPATPAASDFVDKHLAPFLSRCAADLLRQYYPVTSLRGFLVLRRRLRFKRRKSSGSDLCVYDPMTDTRTFLSEPPDISMDDKSSIRSCVLLTAADGISCSSFLLLVAETSIIINDRLEEVRTIRVQTSTPSDTGDISWGAITKSACHSGPFQEHRSFVVLTGGIIHWLTGDRNEILAYDVRGGELGTVKYPDYMSGNLHLAKSSDGRLRILAINGFEISVCQQLTTGGWLRGATIDMGEKLRSINPNNTLDVLLALWYGGKIRNNALLLQIGCSLIVLDLETKEMRIQEDSASTFLFEVDLPARLQAIKMFS